MLLLHIVITLSKCLVATNDNDARFQEEKFQRAIAIFANNDVKYDTNKQRAKRYAMVEGKGITR